VTGIVCSMLPLASVGGPVVIGVAVASAGLLVWWLLRAETRDEAAEQAEETEQAKETEQAEQEAARAAGEQVVPETDEDQLSAR
jgi:hypothetical protein